jgi:hypothetical protein
MQEIYLAFAGKVPYHPFQYNHLSPLGLIL